MRRWLALAVLALGLTMGLSKASGETNNFGLNVVGYSITDVPPVRSDTEYQQCGVGWYEQINYTWDYEENLFGDCGWDSFMLHYTGFITIPDGVESVRFGIASDDGSDVTINDVNFGGWYDKGCSIDYSDRVVLPTDEPLKLDAFMYENGGGTCLMLFWQFNGDDQDWFIVPASAFSNETVKRTTTTLEATTTTTIQPTTTTEELTTTTSTSTTSTSTTSTTLAPSITTTSVHLTTTTSSTTTTVVPETTTTSSSTTVVVPQVITTSSTATTVLPEITTTSSTTTTIPDKNIEIVSPKVLDLLTNIKELPPEEIKQAIDSVIADGINKSEAQILASSPEVIANVTSDQAKEIFVSVDEGGLTNEQGLAIVNAVQNADVKVRKVFETAINVFNGHTDTYQPIGSAINVGQRRVMIISGLASMAATALPPKRRKNE